MVDDADTDASLIEQPDSDRVYRHYLETCRRCGVTPVSRERAHDLIAEWSDVKVT
jgi:Cdc6-like AAA superfamily ATPase